MARLLARQTVKGSPASIVLDEKAKSPSVLDLVHVPGEIGTMLHGSRFGCHTASFPMPKMNGQPSKRSPFLVQTDLAEELNSSMAQKLPTALGVRSNDHSPTVSTQATTTVSPPTSTPGLGEPGGSVVICFTSYHRASEYMRLLFHGCLTPSEDKL